MSSGTLRGLAVGFAHMLGYYCLLPLVESEETYVQVPIELQKNWVVSFLFISPFDSNNCSAYSKTELSLLFSFPYQSIGSKKSVYEKDGYTLSNKMLYNRKQ